MRVSSTQMVESSLYGIMTSYAKFDAAQNELNTGKILQTPSDNPSGTAQTLNLRENVSELEQFGRTMDQAKGFLSTSESALDSVSTLLRQARSIAVQGANDSINDQTRQSLANQVQDIITQLGNIANTAYGSRSVFAGQNTTQPAFVGSGSGFVYQGGTAASGNSALYLDIGRNETLQINVSGDQVFSPLIEDQVGPPVVKSVLASLRDNLAYSGAASGVISRQDIAALDTQINNVLQVRADMGAKIQRIEQTQQRNDLTKVSFTKFISDIEDADIPKTIVKLQSAQTGYQAALQSTARAFQSSLLDFLK